MLLPFRRLERERRCEGVGEIAGFVAADGQSRAMGGPVGRERRDDQRAARPDRGRGSFDVLRALDLVGQEVERGAVVLLMFAIAGGADMISGVFRSTIAMSVTPDDMRGRVSGVEIAVYAGGPVLGDVEAGVVGGVVGVPFAVVSGGLACIAAAGAFALWVPSFFGYRRHAKTTSVG